MADLSPEKLEPNVGFLSPTGGGSSGAGIAQAISSVGNAALRGYSLFAQKELDRDFQSLVQGELEAPKQELTANEIAQIDDFGTRLDRLDALATSGGRRTEFEARARTLLKEHISRTPGLADQFRARASSVITDSDLMAEFKASEEQIDEAERFRLAIEYDATSLGITPDVLRTPEGRAEYQRRKRDADTLRQKQIASQLGSEEDQVALSFSTLSQDAVSDGINANQVLQVTMDEMFPDVDWRNEDPLELRGQFPDRMREVGAVYSEWSDQYRNSITAGTAHMNGEQYTRYTDARFKELEEVSSFLSGDKRLQEISDMQDIRLGLANAGMANSKIMNTLQTISSLGIQPPASLNAAAAVEMEGYFTSVYGEGGYTPIDVQTQSRLSQEVVADSWSAAMSQVEDNTAAGQVAVNIMQTFADSEEIPEKTWESWVNEINANPEDVKKVFQQAPSAVAPMQEAMASHVGNLAATVETVMSSVQSSSLFKEEVLLQGGSRTRRATTQENLLVDFNFDDATGVTISSSTEGDATRTTRQGRRTAMTPQGRRERKIAEIQTKYLKPMNEALRALEETTGVPKRDALIRSLQGTQFLELLNLEDSDAEEGSVQSDGE